MQELARTSRKDLSIYAQIAHAYNYIGKHKINIIYIR